MVVDYAHNIRAEEDVHSRGEHHEAIEKEYGGKHQHKHFQRVRVCADLKLGPWNIAVPIATVRVIPDIFTNR